MAVSVQATFSKEERELNGLEGIRQAIIDDPLRRWFVIVEVECTEISIDVKDGMTKTPKVRWVSAEPVFADAEMAARKLRDEAYHERTGQTAPPPTLFDDGVSKEGTGDAAGPPWPGDSDYSDATGSSNGQDVGEDANTVQDPVRQGRRR